MNILTEKDFKKLVPAAFTPDPEPSVTYRYQYVNTMEIVNRVIDRGYVPVKARQNKPKDKNKAKYAFHHITFEPKPSGDNVYMKLSNENIIPRLELTNSHDRTRRLTLQAGLFRLVCTNGLVVALEDPEGNQLAVSGKQLHLKGKGFDNAVDKLIDNAMNKLDSSAQLIGTMNNFEIDYETELWLATQAIHYAYPQREFFVKAIELTKHRRDEDAGNSLWLAMNRIQENVMKGGIQSVNGRVIKGLGLNAVSTGAFNRNSFNEHLWKDAMLILNGVN